MSGSLTAIHIHPVKSCRALALDEVDVTPRGLSGDRLFQVVDDDGNPVTQRERPVLATVRPELTDDGLLLHAEGRQPLEVAAPVANDTTATSLLGVPVEAGDVGDAAAAWFTDVVGQPVRLVAMTDKSDYRIPMPGGEMVLSWADGASVVIANEASCAWLTDRANEPFGMDRFRPNLTVAADAWAEDTWRDVSIGAARFGVGLAWPRCAIPQVDQIDGTRHQEPARVLRAHRWCSEAPSAPEAIRPILEGNALFGIGCSVRHGGVTIAVGDPITVHETGERMIPDPATNSS